MLERPAKNLPVLLLSGATMTSGANLQLADHLSLYVANKQLRHRAMIAMLSSDLVALGDLRCFGTAEVRSQGELDQVGEQFLQLLGFAGDDAA